MVGLERTPVKGQQNSPQYLHSLYQFFLVLVQGETWEVETGLLYIAEGMVCKKG